jgi:hypothetical protein
VAIWDAWRGHTEEWVATGTAPRTPLGNRIARLMAGWLCFVQLALWLGIAYDLALHTLTLGDIYPLILFAIFALYLHAPLMLSAMRRSQPAASPALYPQEVAV